MLKIVYNIFKLVLTGSAAWKSTQLLMAETKTDHENHRHRQWDQIQER